jgi:shikimate kinase
MLGREFIDLDERIEEFFGLGVAEIFAKYGEEEFRRAESRMLIEAAVSGGKVIALGGGTLLKAENAGIIEDGGALVWLKPEFGILKKRLEKSAKRPLLKDDADLEELYAMRLAGYEKAAIRIEIGETELPEETARKIAGKIDERF